MSLDYRYHPAMDSFNHIAPFWKFLREVKEINPSTGQYILWSTLSREESRVRFLPILEKGINMWLDFQVRSSKGKGMENNLR